MSINLKRIGATISFIILVVASFVLLRPVPGNYSSVYEAYSVCGADYYSVYNDSPFYDVVKLETTQERPLAWHDDQDSYMTFACDEQSAQAYADRQSETSSLLYSTFFAPVWISFLAALWILYWLIGEVPHQLKNRAKEE